MIVTKNYRSLNAIRKIPLLGFLINLFLKNITKHINLKLHSGVHKYIILDENINIHIEKFQDAISYSKLYNTYSSVIDHEELSNMIDEYIKISKLDFNTTLLTSYYYAFFIGYWCQLVEHYILLVRSCDEQIIYLGSKTDIEYKILLRVFNIYKTNLNGFKNEVTISTYLLGILSNLSYGFIKRKEKYSKKIFNNFNNSKKNTLKIDRPNLFLISIYENRRFSRVEQLFIQLTKLGYTVILHSCLPRKDILNDLKKYPILYDNVIFDYSYISKREAKSVVNSEKSKLVNLHKIQKQKVCNLYYKNINLFDILWNELGYTLIHRGMQAAINIVSIKRFINQNRLVGYLGMDNSIATSVWLTETKQKSIPNFFHYYNASLLPVVYKLLLKSYDPTIWLLGGKRQLQLFKSIKGLNNSNYVIVGDLFVDTVVNCDKLEINKKIRFKYSLKLESKIVVLLSSYVYGAFTEQIKEIFFKMVYLASKDLNLCLIIKSHPNENIQLLKSQLEQWGIVAKISLDDNIRDISIVSDVIIMNFSEAAQQAMLVGTPIISVVSNELKEVYDRHWDYFSTNSVDFIPLGEDIKPKLSNLISNKVYKENLIQNAFKYTEDLFGSNDGHNSIRFAKILDFHIKKSFRCN